jgi:hypothetical protein
MEDSFGMRCFEAIRGLNGDIENLIRLERLPANALLESLTGRDRGIPRKCNLFPL